MSIWNKIEMLHQADMESIYNLYGEEFPVQVRIVLASWIEERVGNLNVDPDNPTHEEYIKNFTETLLNEIESTANAMVQEEKAFLRFQLLGALPMLKQKYAHDPVSLFRFLRRCHNMELTYLQHLSCDAELMVKIEYIQAASMETENLLCKLEQEGKTFVIRCHNREAQEEILCTNWMQNDLVTPTPVTQIVSSPRSPSGETAHLEAELKMKLAELMRLKAELDDKLTNTVIQLTVVEAMLRDKLETIKLNKRLIEVDATQNTMQINNMDNLLSSCEDVSELIWNSRNQLQQFEKLGQIVPVVEEACRGKISALIKKVTQLLASLLNSAFIIEKEPPQVIIKPTGFVATVRLLVGSKLKLQLAPPRVKVVIVNEAQACKLIGNDRLDETVVATSGDVLNNTVTMQYNERTRDFCAHFRNLRIKDVLKTKSNVAESVTDEKFYLHFQCQLRGCGEEPIFKIATLSIPIVVIVHRSQEAHGWATITYSNCFGERGQMPFQLPDKVSWNQMAHTINAKFHAMTGRGLSDDHIQFLAEKLFGNTLFKTELTRHQFCKKLLQDRTFTFWDWFFAAMKLTRERLQALYVNGLVVGFISKEKAVELLKPFPPGTFLIRFSDSELGGVTIAWVHTYESVLSIAPFSTNDLKIRSLADRIMDLPHLAYLYPNTSKVSAFSKYCTTPVGANPINKNGYVPAGLQTTIPSALERQCDQSALVGFGANSDTLLVQSQQESTPARITCNTPELMDMLVSYNNCDDNTRWDQWHVDSYVPNGNIDVNIITD